MRKLVVLSLSRTKILLAFLKKAYITFSSISSYYKTVHLVVYFFHSKYEIVIDYVYMSRGNKLKRTLTKQIITFRGTKTEKYLLLKCCLACLPSWGTVVCSWTLWWIVIRFRIWSLWSQPSWICSILTILSITCDIYTKETILENTVFLKPISIKILNILVAKIDMEVQRLNGCNI